MTTDSYPKVNANFTGGQWRNIFDGAYGIVDATGSAISCGDLVRTNASDAATIKAGLRYLYRGYVLEVTADHAMTLAAATTTPLTYSIGVMFDPANEATNPLALYSSLKASITIPSGGSFKTLYEVTRATSQTLDLAAVKDFRQYVAEPILAPALAAADLPADAPLGTVAYTGSENYLRTRNGTSAVWSNLTNPAFANLTLLSGAGLSSFGTAPASRVRLGQVEVVGGVQKSTPFFGTATTVAVLPVGQRPGRTWRFATACSYNESDTTARVEVAPDGSISILASTGGATDHSWVQLDGISFPVGG